MYIRAHHQVILWSAIIACIWVSFGSLPVQAEPESQRVVTTNPSEADYGLTAAISEAVGPDIKKALLFAELVGDANAPTAWLQIGMTIERGGRLESHEIKGDQLHKIALKIFEDAARNDRSVLFLLAALRGNELTISYGFERDVPEGGVPFFIYEAAIEKHFGQPWIVEPSPPPPANQVVQRGLVGEEEYLSVL